MAENVRSRFIVAWFLRPEAEHRDDWNGRCLPLLLQGEALTEFSNGLLMESSVHRSGKEDFTPVKQKIEGFTGQAPVKQKIEGFTGQAPVK